MDSQYGPTKTIFGQQILRVKADQGELEMEYPYWDKAETDWYLHNFLTDRNTRPVEEFAGRELQFTYRYCDRSVYADGGFGYLLASIRAMKKLGVHVLPSDKASALSLISELAHFYHPFNFLNSLLGFGKELFEHFLKNETDLKVIVRSTRRDSLKGIINVLKADPNARNAITPSFMLNNIDFNGIIKATPPYQNFQVFINQTPNGEKYLTTCHLHRSIDAKGGLQLDYAHDLTWGKMVGKELGLPLREVIILANNTHIYLNSSSTNVHQELVGKPQIDQWLMRVTQGYQTKSAADFVHSQASTIEKALGKALA